jgi:DNA (cytosine-5)-methyltransferase 1
MKRITTVDLFAGGGGLSLGFANGGFKVLAAFENWLPAIAVYEKNFPDHPVLSMDLGDVAAAADSIAAFKADVIVGGPPCQDFSSAGKRDESGGRADLTIAFAKIIDRVRPQYFVMENVDRAAKSVAFSEALNIFKAAGYGITAKVLDASRCGAPQLRKRLFVIGGIDERDDFLSEPLDRFQRATSMTIREYVGNSLGIDHYYRHPRSYARRAVFSIDEPSPTVRGVNRPVPMGYPGHPGDVVPIHALLRPLTTRERATIQTFPTDFQLVGTKTDVEQVIGNAVPVKLAQYVAERLQMHIVSRHADRSNQPLAQASLFQPKPKRVYLSRAAAAARSSDATPVS